MRPERPLCSPRPPLASVQAALLSWITGQGLGAPAVDPPSLIHSDARAGADERLAVYAHMYRARLVEALESQFPRLARLVGAEAFADLTADYVADAPSRHPSLRELGRALPLWLAERRAERPALASLAALEWARVDLYDQADEAAMTLETPRAWPPERLGELPLRLIAAHRFVEVAGGTEALWDALSSDATEVPSALVASSALRPSAPLLVWRQEIAVYHRALAPDECAALAALADGSCFGVICERLAAVHGDELAAGRAFGWLSTWLTDGLLVQPA
ncbi:MAG TPA: DNA-binding domain-containing protein [Polyangia bacterium]|jgi:hypothetical protein|nr:DNA-binding domain-containing protein [Polyangia bacterium]